MAKQDIYKLLQECTVRLSSSSGGGTGFFIAPDGLILTCNHVVEQSSNVDVFWSNAKGKQNFTATVKLRLPIPIDIAILQIEGKFPKHGCVYLDQSLPQIGEDLVAFGYPQGYDSENYSGGDTATAKYEGEGFQENISILKLKDSQIQEGCSGSPLLNRRNSKVCGVVSISRNTSLDLGGRATPISILFQPNKITGSLNEQRLILETLDRNKNFHKKIDRTWSKIVRQSFWDRKTSVAIAAISLISLIILYLDTPNNLITLTLLRFVIACGFGYSSLLFVRSLNLGIANINRFPISSLSGILIAFLMFLFSFVIIPEISIVIRNLTGINVYPTFGIIEKSLPTPLRKALDINSTPIIDTNNPIYSAIQAFRDESDNASLMTKYEKPSGISSAFNQDGRTVRKTILASRGSGLRSKENTEEIIHQNLNDFEEEPQRFEGEASYFTYSTAIVPFQTSLEDAEWTTISPLTYGETDKNLEIGTLLQYPKLSDINKQINTEKHDLSTKNKWIKEISASNPEVRGFLAFTYRYLSILSSDWLSDLFSGCGFIGIERIAPTPYVRFIDIHNNSLSSLKVDSIRTKVIEKDKYKLTPIFNRNQLFQEVTSKDELLGISIAPSSHLLLLTEFGFDTRNSKNILKEYAETISKKGKNKTDQNVTMIRLINRNLFVSKIPPLSKRNFTTRGRQKNPKDTIPSQFLDSVNFSKEFISQVRPLIDLSESIPNRFAVGSLKNIIAIRINGKDIPSDNPLNDPRFSMSVYFAFGSCPYLVVYDTKKGYWIDLGTTLTGRQTKGQKTSEIYSLGENPSKFKIEERDKEITYLDSVSILYTDKNTGEEKEISSHISKLDAIDDVYYVLHQNESLEIDLKKLLPESASNIRMKINGYYELLPDAIPMHLQTNS